MAMTQQKIMLSRAGARRIRKGARPLTLTAALICWAADASAAKWYVGTGGDDHNAGTEASPFRTIGKGVGLLRAGDTLYVGSGVYVEVVGVAQSGAPDAPIRIVAMPNERPVIDGEEALPDKEWKPLVALRGNYIEIRGFEIRKASRLHGTGLALAGDFDRAVDVNVHHNYGNGVMLIGRHDVVEHSNVDHNYGAGVLAEGDDSVVDSVAAWQNAYANCRAAGCPPSPYPHGGWATGISAARSPVDGITKHAILRNNTVFNNWGEGLSTFEAKGTIMENNVVYDNWATNTYISDASDVRFVRNLVYATPESAIQSSHTDEKACLTLADERADKPRSDGNVVIDNMFYGCNVSAFAWTLVPGSGLSDAVIAQNTIIHGEIETGPIDRNSRIVDNIIENSGPVGKIPTAAGLTFSHNLWSSAPPPAGRGVGDIIAAPAIAKIGPTTPGALSRAYFRLLPESPARHAGIAVEGAAPVDAKGAGVTIGAD